MSGKRPYFRFFPADWRSDPGLRMCSIAARGLWMEMLCLMHDGEPYGHLALNGRSMPNAPLANLFGTSAKDVAKLLTELESAGVFSRTAEGVIYSRKMVRDQEKLDRDKANGRTGGNPGAARGG